MRPKVIKTIAYYKEVMRRIDKLIDINPVAGSSQADELELLAVLASLYEDRKWPIDPPSPVGKGVGMRGVPFGQ